MNILYIVTWATPQGREKLEAGVFHYEQATSLSQYANVAIYYPYDEQITSDETAQTEWGLMTYRSKFVPGDRSGNRRRMDAMMERIIREFAPDVLHGHIAAGAGHRATDYGRKYHLPVVITEHMPIELSHVDNRLTMGHYLAGKAYKRSQANICVSKDSKNKLSSIYPRCEFDVIYNGIILPDYADNQHIYYKDGYVNFVIVAILYDLEIKGMKYLLEAMAIAKSRGQKIFLHHIGGGEFLDHFKELAVTLGVDDVVEFYGGCDRAKLYEIVSEMDYFVSASLMECSGVSVEEAMLLGKPVLGTNSGGVDSLVPDMAGHIVEKANANALADGMEYMIAHDGDFHRDAIREFAYASFEIDHISQNYMKLYERLLQEWN